MRLCVQFGNMCEVLQIAFPDRRTHQFHLYWHFSGDYCSVDDFVHSHTHVNSIVTVVFTQQLAILAFGFTFPMLDGCIPGRKYVAVPFLLVLIIWVFCLRNWFPYSILLRLQFVIFSNREVSSFRLSIIPFCQILVTPILTCSLIRIIW